MKFRTILADPPWEYVLWSPKGGGRRADDKYQTQGTRWIERLPVEEVAGKDCTLLMWATFPKLPDAFRVIDAWGFIYKSGLPWLKMQAAAAPRVGLGYHARNCAELLLIASRGNAGAPAVEDRPLGVLFNPRGEHSKKPELQYDLAENYPGPYLEMFCRPREGGLFPPRPNWTFLGNEVDGRDMREALWDLARQEEHQLGGVVHQLATVGG